MILIFKITNIVIENQCLVKWRDFDFFRDTMQELVKINVFEKQFHSLQMAYAGPHLNNNNILFKI